MENKKIKDLAPILAPIIKDILSPEYIDNIAYWSYYSDTIINTKTVEKREQREDGTEKITYEEITEEVPNISKELFLANKFIDLIIKESENAILNYKTKQAMEQIKQDMNNII